MLKNLKRLLIIIILTSFNLSAKELCQNITTVNFFHDDNDEYNINTSLEKLRLMPLFTLPKNINFGFTTKPVWVYIKIVAKDLISKEYNKCLLELGNPLIDEIDIYKVLNNKIEFITQMGDNLPFSKRLYHFMNFTFPFKAKYNQEYIIKLKSTSNMTVPVNAQWENEYFKNISLDYMGTALFYGIILCFIYFGLHQYISFKQNAYLFYAVYALFILLFFIARDGFLYQLIWPSATIWNQKAPRIIGCISMIFGILYYLQFIKPQKLRFLKITKSYILLILFYTFIVLITPPIYTHTPTKIIATIYSILMIAISLQPEKKDIVFGPYLLAGAIVSFIGILVHSLSISNLIQSNFFTHNSMKITTVLDFLLLSIAIQKDTIDKVITKQKFNTIYNTTCGLYHDLILPFSKLNHFFHKAAKIPDNELKAFFSRSRDSVLSDINYIYEMLDTLKNLNETPNISKNNNTVRFQDIQKDIHIKFTVDFKYKEYIKINKLILKRIINNLTNNAIEATIDNPNSEYWIKSIEKLEEIQILIGNTGSFIEKEDLPKALNLFYTKGKIRGSGVGLTSSLIEVKKAGGDLLIESNGYLSDGRKIKKYTNQDYVIIHLTIPKGNKNSVYEKNDQTNEINPLNPINTTHTYN